ncbi:basic phospholipase A2 PA-10A isoform X1 [Macrosteles quadrilineatus]|uniref:basic phospholipase A2 PA-10A isoform X1 n=1 Tax=Macrosteles quadrilineatus TaxID=74068 RepID=UPI0023E0DA37|nr:basic phospholipase A2 PA-10A isoform X1 [Macrosteles quadrilineatus]
MTPGGALSWIPILILVAPIMGYSERINTIEENEVTNSTRFQVFVGYSSDPWGASSELEFDSVSDQLKGSRKPKRSVVHLYNMVVCATGCNPLSYKGYGCYCGFLGSGYTMDAIDRCCKMHDWCYSTSDCPMFLEYFVPYYWTCYRHQPLCALGSSCGQRLCECDRRLAECLSHYPCPRTKAVCTSSPWRLLQNILML